MPRMLHTYTVTPTLPERLKPLREMAYNLCWSWDWPSIHLFRRLAGDTLWEASDHNPARLLGLVPQSRLAEAAQDADFLAALDAVYADFRRYLEAPSWWSETFGAEFGPDFRIAYFSAEFGITECLPIYSGGLGVLAGDHLKAASDLGLPLVGIGFLYQRGYFRQGLNADGWQVEHYPTTDFYSLPIEPVQGENGPRTIEVSFPGRAVYAQIWKAQVGRIPLFLLDTNLPINAEADRHIAGNLYGGDNETRIQQEIVLGIGGINALGAMGIRPMVCHMNEGHSAFLALERVRRLIREEKLSFDVAASAAAAGNLFTTHTPVPAGFDLFPTELMQRYFGEYAARLGISFDQLLDRGRHPHGDATKFNMAVLAFRHARHINGVSKLHGAVSRQMAQSVWADFPLDEVPVGSVTNGIHTRSFLSSDMASMLDTYLGNPPDWSKVDEVPGAMLWAVKETRRRKLVEWARRYQEARCIRRGDSERDVIEAREILRPDILTIGFARRFATYKRGDLLLRDIERIQRIISHPDRPVQFVFAGKAHPRDDAGKELIRRIVHFSREPAVRGRVVFLEDYDMSMARYLVQGVDLWLNNPRRPMEASGTSGMKVIANGGLNFSVLDGWWAEGYEPSVGWAIGRGEDYDDHGYQDHVEAQAIYETLEHEIIPLFYERDGDDLPQGWITKMKASMKRLSPVYSTGRMVREYAETFYVPAARLEQKLAADGFQRARGLVAWKKKMREGWDAVKIESVEAERDHLTAGQQASLRAVVRLGATLTPDDVRVQLYAGPVDADRNLTEAHALPMDLAGPAGAGAWKFVGALPTDRSGQLGFTVRVLPYHPDAVLPQELPLIQWE